MFNSPKLWIAVGLGALGLFFVLIFVFPPFTSPQGTGTPVAGLPSVETPKFRPPENIFLPPETAPPTPATPQPTAFEQPKPPVFEASIPSVEEVTRVVSDALGSPSLPPPPSALLELPAISNESLNITPNGPSDPVGYVESFAVGAFEKIKFDGRRFENVVKDENGLPLLPQQLVEKGIAEKKLAPLKESLIVFRDFISAKSEFGKGLPVSGAAIAVAKENVSFDILTLALIDKALAVADGQLPLSDLEEFYGKFEATAEFRREQFLRSTGIVIGNDGGIFRKIAKFLAGGNVAFAQLPFGTFIGPPIFCTCSFSFWIPAGPPLPPPSGALNANLAWIASPAFFPFKSLRPGAAWLGNYSATLTPCLQFILFGCAPIPGFGNPPIIAGTSI